MKTRHALLLLAAIVAVSEMPLIGQPAAARFIVVFHDDAPLASFPPGRADERSRANPAAWAYLDRSVVGAIQTLEARSGFRADHVYGSAVRGFAARLTPDQVEAIRW
jgi:hypothetical protein